MCMESAIGAASIQAPGTVCPSSWHDYGHERKAAAIGEGQSGTWQGSKNGGEAQLAAASNWAEQVSMAD